MARAMWSGDSGIRSQSQLKCPLVCSSKADPCGSRDNGRPEGKRMITKDLVAAGKLENTATGSIDVASALRFTSRVVMAAAVVLSAYGLVWNFSTRRYLKGFT